MSKFVHPDVVVGEVIAEIEPRVDGDVLAAIEMLTRWGLVFLPVYVLVSMVFLVFPLSVFASYGFILAGVFVWSVPFYRVRKVLKEYKAEQWSVPLGVEIKNRLVLGTTCFSLILPLMMSNGVIWILGIWGGYLLIFGCACVALKWLAREPGQVSCVGCSYSLVGLVLPCECPECGRFLYGVLDTTDRPRVFSAWFGWVGSGMVVLGLAILFGVFFRPGLMYERLPRSVLLELAVTDDAAFSELILLPMSEDEQSRLIDDLISANNFQGRWSQYSYEHGDWLVQCFGDGSMDDAQVARILEPYIEEDVIELVGPDAVRVGESIRVEFQGERVRMPGDEFVPMMYFRGFVIDEEGDDEWLKGSSKARSLSRLTRRGRDVAWQDANAERVQPVYEFLAEEPGVVVVRARAVLALVRGRTRQTAIDWGRPIDGAFGVPVVWYRVIDLEHRVVVER